MKLFHPNPTPDQTLSVKVLCNEVESQYHLQIKQGSNHIVTYLQKNKHLENLFPSVSELLHIIYFKLRYEIKQCILQEKRTLFPLIITATAKDTLQLRDVIEPIRKTHVHILELVEKLRQILSRYEIEPVHSGEFKNFINELRNLENNICKWILVEEDLIFPKVYSDLAKAKFIATVF
ncbi:MAG: hypothetical protein ABI760_14075 [Ferruginibacter sp.]